MISTHTLTWSVTSGKSTLMAKMCISTHTLTWSVTVSGNLAYLMQKISTHTGFVNIT